MTVTLETLEGRLIAHRKLLARIVILLARRPDADDILAFLREQSVLLDGEEDPGAVPAPGLSIEGALADELRLVLEKVEARG